MSSSEVEPATWQCFCSVALESADQLQGELVPGNCAWKLPIIRQDGEGSQLDSCLPPSLPSFVQVYSAGSELLRRQDCIVCPLQPLPGRQTPHPGQRFIWGQKWLRTQRPRRLSLSDVDGRNARVPVLVSQGSRGWQLKVFESRRPRECEGWLKVLGRHSFWKSIWCGYLFNPNLLSPWTEGDSGSRLTTLDGNQLKHILWLELAQPC